MINENWSRWIFASLSKHFSENISLHVFIEGQHRSTKTMLDFCEFRMDGPHYSNTSKGFWTAEVEVNILITSTITGDFHKIHRNIGDVIKAFTGVKIYEYGDSGNLLTCMNIVPVSRGKDVLVNHFGQLEPSKELMQATVDGKYRAELTT